MTGIISNDNGFFAKCTQSSLLPCDDYYYVYEVQRARSQTSLKAHFGIPKNEPNIMENVEHIVLFVLFVLFKLRAYYLMLSVNPAIKDITLLLCFLGLG